MSINSRIVCLVGSGDSCKSTLLTAIEWALWPSWSLIATDMDFYNCDTTDPIEITVSMTELPDALVRENKFGLYLRDYTKSFLEGDDEPTDDGFTILTVQLTIDESLEPKWNVITNRNDPRPISQKDRCQLSFGVVGCDHEKDFQWGRGSVLQKYADSRDALHGAFTQAMRSAVENTNLDSLDEMAPKMMEVGGQYGVSFKGEIHNGYGIYLSVAAVPSNPDILLLDWSINPFESSPERIGRVSDDPDQTIAEWAVNHGYNQLIRLSIGSPSPEPYTHGRLVSSEKYDPNPTIADKQIVQSDGWLNDLISNGPGFDSYINRQMVLEEDGTSLIMIAGGFTNQKEYEIACFMMPWRTTEDGKEDPVDYNSPGLDPQEPIYDMENRERGMLSFAFPDNPTVSSTVLAEYNGEIPLLSNPELNGHIHIKFVRTQLNDYCLAEYSDPDRVYEHLLIYENETPGSFISYSKLYVSCYQLKGDTISFLRSCIVPDEFPETIFLQWVDDYENIRQTFTINKQ